MWLRPQPLGQPQSWHDWFQDWQLWFDQVKTNLWYGRGGLNVKVGNLLLLLPKLALRGTIPRTMLGQWCCARLPVVPATLHQIPSSLTSS